MAYAPISAYNERSILGSFKEKEFGTIFEFTKNPAHSIFLNPQGTDEFPHLIFVNNFEKNWPYRYARVLKTCAYIVVDEDAGGNPVVEKWDIKGHRLYTM